MDNPIMKSFGCLADGVILPIYKDKIRKALICRYSLLPILIIMICSVYVNLASGETSPYNYNKDTRVSYFKEQLSSDTISPELKLSYYDSLIYRLPTDMPTLLLKKARILRDMPGLGYKKEALTLYENMSKMEGKYGIHDNLETLYTLSSLYLQLKDPLNALIWAGKLLSSPTPDSLNYYKVKTYLALSNIFMYLEDDEKTESSINNGLKLIEQEKEHTPIMIYSSLKSGLLSRKASLMTVKKNYAEAFELFSEAKRLFPPNANRIDVNTGALFSEQGQHDLGNKYYMNALTSSSDEEIRGVAAFNLVLSYAQMGEYDKFWEFINQHEDDLKYMDSRIQGATLWALKSEAYENLENYRAALYAQRVADSIRNEVMSPENIREIEKEYQQINIKEKDS